MERSSGSRCPWTSISRSFHHHYHHFPHHHYPLVQFPHHHHLICCPHHRVLASFTPVPPQNSDLVSNAPLQNLEADAALLKEDADDHGTQMLQYPEQEQQHKGFEEVEEDDEDPIFVLTDEWREFFAKSEAKRKLEKKLKQAKRK